MAPGLPSSSSPLWAKQSLENVLKTAETTRILPLTCPLCGPNFAKGGAAALTEHILMDHMNRDDNQIQCSSCRAMFNDPDQAHVHIAKHKQSGVSDATLTFACPKPNEMAMALKIVDLAICTQYAKKNSRSSETQTHGKPADARLQVASPLPAISSQTVPESPELIHRISDRDCRKILLEPIVERLADPRVERQRIKRFNSKSRCIDLPFLPWAEKYRMNREGKLRLPRTPPGSPPPDDETNRRSASLTRRGSGTRDGGGTATNPAKTGINDTPQRNNQQGRRKRRWDNQDYGNRMTPHGYSMYQMPMMPSATPYWLPTPGMHWYGALATPDPSVYGAHQTFPIPGGPSPTPADHGWPASYGGFPMPGHPAGAFIPSPVPPMMAPPPPPPPPPEYSEQQPPPLPPPPPPPQQTAEGVVGNQQVKQEPSIKAEVIEF